MFNKLCRNTFNKKKLKKYIYNETHTNVYLCMEFE